VDLVACDERVLQDEGAAWFFIQWATGTQNTTFGAVNADLVDPVRDSVWKVPSSSPAWKRATRLLEPVPEVDRPVAHLLHAAAALPEFTTDWAAMLQQMYAKQIPIDEGLDKLAAGLERKLREVASEARASG